MNRSVLLLLCFFTASAAAVNYADVVDEVMPAVVSISSVSTKEVVLSASAPRISLDARRVARQKVGNIGSGFIISKDGYIVTNHHIIEDAQSPIVLLYNKQEYRAKIIGTDKKTDIALLKIASEQDLPYVKISSLSDMRMGDSVLAIGNPFGFGHAVTAGIISAMPRYIDGSAIEFIQTDAAINKGNSGGPLFDMKGEVIGVNSMIASQGSGGGNVGVGFAIPIDIAMNIIHKLRDNIKITRPWIGISYYYVNIEVAAAVQMSGVAGVFVHDVSDNSPAARAGVRPGDVMLSINGQKITRDSSPNKLISKLQVGDRVLVKLWRFGKKIKIALILSEQQEEDEKHSAILGVGSGGGIAFGISARELTPGIRKKLGIEGHVSGVVVSSINNETITDDGKLYNGDVIVGVNNMKTPNIKTFRDAMAALEKKKSTAAIFYIAKSDGTYPVPISLR